MTGLILAWYLWFMANTTSTRARPNRAATILRVVNAIHDLTGDLLTGADTLEALTGESDPRELSTSQLERAAVELEARAAIQRLNPQADTLFHVWTHIDGRIAVGARCERRARDGGPIHKPYAYLPSIEALELEAGRIENARRLDPLLRDYRGEELEAMRAYARAYREVRGDA